MCCDLSLWKNFRIKETIKALRIPAIYRPNNTRPCRFMKPHTVCSGMKAAINKAYTGRRAEQVINGATNIVVRRSRGSLIVREAIIPGTAQAKLDNRGMKARPERPALNINLSSRKAARGK